MLLRVATAVLATAVAAAGLSGCNEDEEPQEAPPSASSTPLTDFSTEALAVTRAEFCSRVAPAAVEEALDAAVDSADSYENGQRTSVAPGVRDVVHEYGCTWKAADGTVARAWLFAPPVTTEQARTLREAATGKGCTQIEDAPPYGAPSVAVRCGDTTAFHGLFGDAWLSCSIEAPGDGDPAALLDRTGRWCLSVALAAG